MTLESAKGFLEIVGVFFMVYLIIYSTFLLLSVVVGSSRLYKKKQLTTLHNEINHDFYYPVTIIVPAYNEDITVLDTVKSLLELEYRLYEIVVVDDGSKDDTAQILIDYFHMKKVSKPIQKKILCEPEEYVYESHREKVPIILIRKKNGGKADALNMGINAAHFPYFICMDADSILQADALENIMKPILDNEKIVACGGLVRIVNGVTFKNGRPIQYDLPGNLLVCMQILEYDRSFLATRLLFDAFNGNLIISGAFGMFHKETAIAVGGYDHNTLGEDMELVVKLHVFCLKNKIPYSICYAADAVCWSQAPSTLSDLKKQRKRWHLGLFQSMWKHRQICLNPQFGAMGFVSYLYFLFYELLSPYIELFGVITIVFAFYLNLINVPFMIFFFMTYALFGGILTLTAFFARIYTQNGKMSLKDVMKAILLCVLENVGLRMGIAFIRMTAFVKYKEKKMQWGKIERYKMNDM